MVKIQSLTVNEGGQWEAQRRCFLKPQEKNNTGTWEMGQDTFSKTESYKFRQCVTMVGWGQRISSHLAMPPQPSFLQ